MNLAFLIGFLLAPIGVAIISALTSFLFAPEDGWLVIFLCVVPAIVSATGFSVGRNSNPLSSAPIVSWGRSIVCGVIGFFCALISLPIGAEIFRHLSESGVWRQIFFGVWFLCSGIFCGYKYGVIFKRAAKQFPSLRKGESVG